MSSSEILAHDERVVNFCDTGLVLAEITVKATVKVTVKAAVKAAVKATSTVKRQLRRQLRAVESVGYPPSLHYYVTTEVQKKKVFLIFSL